MIGGLGWSRKQVRDFWEGIFYVIPCGMVPTGDDPYGRIIFCSGRGKIAKYVVTK